MANRNPRKNSEGYSDPTAYEAIKKVSKEEVRLRRMLHDIHFLCERNGFKIENRIVLVDTTNGKVWR